MILITYVIICSIGSKGNNCNIDSVFEYSNLHQLSKQYPSHSHSRSSLQNPLSCCSSSLLAAGTLVDCVGSVVDLMTSLSILVCTCCCCSCCCCICSLSCCSNTLASACSSSLCFIAPAAASISSWVGRDIDSTPNSPYT